MRKKSKIYVNNKTIIKIHSYNDVELNTRIVVFLIFLVHILCHKDHIQAYLHKYTLTNHISSRLTE